MKRRYVIMPALRMPHENKTALAATIKFIEDYRPDEIVQLGAVACMNCVDTNTQLSVGARSEIHDTIKVDKYAREQFFIPLRSIFSGPVLLTKEDMRSLAAIEQGERRRGSSSENHVRTHNHKRSFDSEYELSRLPVRYSLAPGWITQSKKSTPNSSRIPGKEAWSIAKQSHAHRQIRRASGAIGYRR